MIGTLGVDPESVLWMTPREMNAAAEGRSRAERLRFVTVAQAFGGDLSEKEAQSIIEGDGEARAPSQQEQMKRLEQMKERHGWD